jgi:hypothetical protein
LLFIINTILAAGIIGTFLSFFLLHRLVRWFPALAPYHLLIQIVSIVLLVGGVYFKGGYGIEMAWRERAASLEAKIKVAEEKAKKNNEKIIIKYRDRVKVVTETKVVIEEKIKESAKVIDSQCIVATEAINILNEAAKMPEGIKK